MKTKQNTHPCPRPGTDAPGNDCFYSNECTLMDSRSPGCTPAWSRACTRVRTSVCTRMWNGPIRRARGPCARARRDPGSRTDHKHPKGLTAPPNETCPDHRVGRTGHRMQKNTLSLRVPEQRSGGPKCSLGSDVDSLQYSIDYGLSTAGAARVL
jgi:hypothetical protein